MSLAVMTLAAIIGCAVSARVAFVAGRESMRAEFEQREFADYEAATLPESCDGCGALIGRESRWIEIPSGALHTCPPVQV